jgi:2'-5' RNA ligase
MKDSEADNIYPPLILTLALDESSQTFFDSLRGKYFPPDRNYLQAHLTLFHHLPGKESAAISEYLAKVASEYERMALEVTEVKMIGRGVAYKIENDALIKLHRQLAQKWQAWLTPQDQQKLWPHVTVQNKVDPAKARALYEKLAENFEPFTAFGTGLKLWVYRGGPWEWLQTFPFRSQVYMNLYQ